MLYRPNAGELQALTLFCLSQFRATTHRNVVCNYLVTSPLSVAPSREKKPSNERFRSMC